MKFHEILNRLIEVYGARIHFKNIAVFSTGDTLINARFEIKEWEEFELEFFAHYTGYRINCDRPENAAHVRANIEGYTRNDAGERLKKLWALSDTSPETMKKFEALYSGTFENGIPSVAVKVEEPPFCATKSEKFSYECNECGLFWKDMNDAYECCAE